MPPPPPALRTGRRGRGHAILYAGQLGPGGFFCPWTATSENAVQTLQNAPGRPPPKPSVPSWRPKRTATFQNGIENAVQTLQNAPKRCGTTAPEAKCSLVTTQADRHDSKTLQNVRAILPELTATTQNGVQNRSKSFKTARIRVN